MGVAQKIHDKLSAALSPDFISINDESFLHKGHAGAPEVGESHFRVHVIAKCFEGLNRVARQRMVNDVLREELSGPVHALTMRTLTPAEADREALSIE